MSEFGTHLVRLLSGLPPTKTWEIETQFRFSIDIYSLEEDT